MSITSKFSIKLAHIFSNDKKSNASTQAIAASQELEASQEKARKEQLLLNKTARIGFPCRPTCIAYDVVQHMMAVGTKYGYVKLYGGESVEYTLFHGSSTQAFGQVPTTSPNINSNQNSSASNSTSNSTATLTSQLSMPQSASATSAALNFPSAVLFMSFVINEGALITYCDDSTINFWNLRQKQPAILFSKKLVNERATAMHLQFQSNWLYVGTEKGNTYLLNVYNNFAQSGYDIKWNNVIELSQKTKPGKVIHLSEHPLDSTKILMGFDSGLIVLWNLKSKRAELRFYGTAETMGSICWFHDGKQFMSSHNNGSLIVWNCKGNDTKPVNILHPHMNESDLIPKYNMIKKVYWEANKNGEPLIIFSDGLPSTDCSMRDAITIIRNNKLKTIIEMKERIIDFLLVNSSPWITDTPSDPSAIIVLLESNLIVIDLKTDGYPHFQNHHPINLHESPVSINYYLIEPSKGLYQTLVQSKQQEVQQQLAHHHHQQQQQQQQANAASVGSATTSTPFFSNLPYPINGGVKCAKSNTFQYNELIMTGHEDGSVKVWDSSGLSLTLLNKLKTQKIFDKRKYDNLQLPSDLIDYPLKITCLQVFGYYLAVAAAGGHVTLYKYYSKSSNSSSDELADMPIVDITMNESTDNARSQNDNQNSDLNSSSGFRRAELKCLLRSKIGFRRQDGYQPELVCMLHWSQRPPVVTSIFIDTKNNILCFGTDESIICVDIINRIVLLNANIADLNQHEGGQKNQKSPKKNMKNYSEYDEQNSIDQHNSPHLLSKQMTVDYSAREAKDMRDTLSKSSSGSSMENLNLTEGVTTISMNTFLTVNSKEQQLSQIWLGTNYGSAIVLNLISYTSNSNAANSNSSNASNQNDILNNAKPSAVIQPTGTTYSLKGQIVDIAFLDINGNLLSANETESSRVIKKQTSAIATTSSIPNQDDIGDLDIDFSYLSSNTVSNSIAENFGGGGSSQVNNANDIAASSPTTGTPTSAASNINNIIPATEEIKTTSSKTKKLLSATRLSKIEFGVTKDVADSNNNTTNNNNVSLSSTESNKQFVVITSEQQIKIVALPTQACIHKYTLNSSEGQIAKASVAVINSLSYLTCYMTNGNYIVFNLPNPTLKSISNLNSPLFAIKEKEDRASRTFAFGGKGHSVFMCSPTEIQKVYLSTAGGSNNLTDMISEFFDPRITSPPPPKPNIFKSLFTANPTLDREELFGESSGKPSTCIVKNLDGEVQKTRKELSELQKLALERGEKLNALQMKTEEMTQAASAFAKNAQDLANKYKSRKFF